MCYLKGREDGFLKNNFPSCRVCGDYCHLRTLKLNWPNGEVNVRREAKKKKKGKIQMDRLRERDFES